jgi:hypothetical protein
MPEDRTKEKITDNKTGGEEMLLLEFRLNWHLASISFGNTYLINNPSKSIRMKSVFLSNAPRFPKEHCFL